MTNSIHSTIIRELEGEPGYVMVNVRPGEKVAAMIDVLCRLSGMTPSALVSDEIPHRLVAEALLETSGGAVNRAARKVAFDAALKAAKEHIGVATDKVYPNYVYRYQKGSALHILSNEMKLFSIIDNEFNCIDEEMEREWLNPDNS